MTVDEDGLIQYAAMTGKVQKMCDGWAEMWVFTVQSPLQNLAHPIAFKPISGAVIQLENRKACAK